jgi:DNA-directed RNA polymerase subunit beta'
MLQEAVDALIDNGRRGRPVTGPNNRPLKSLSDILKGKQGRFRQNLLGKRVDYSGRSVIVVGPNLKLHQCGLPKEMALELFKPFVMKKLVDRAQAHNIKSAKRMVERVRPEVWDVLDEVIREHPVLLNRAPTLHRLGIQAFEPVLVEGKAIHLHPLVCTPYNADFDGDQMAVHLPLSAGAQAEARILMLSSNNILQPSFGNPVSIPTQDMVLGLYWLTFNPDEYRGPAKAVLSDDALYSSPVARNGHARKMPDGSTALLTFKDSEEAVTAYEHRMIGLHEWIQVRIKGQRIRTTVGRVILNEAFPAEWEYPFLNHILDKTALKKLITECYRKFGNAATAEFLDAIKSLGFRYATQSGTTVSISDIIVPQAKHELLDKAQAEVDELHGLFDQGFISDDERYNKTIEVWQKAGDDVTLAMQAAQNPLNPVFMMATSGARGSIAQVKQLGGMRGLMSDPSGRILEIPVKASLKEGLTVLEYFISTHGARKGLADTALRTADSGYLTRRLVDVAQDVIIREEDCGTHNGILVTDITVGKETIEPIYDRMIGRRAAEDIKDPEKPRGEKLIKRDEEIDEEKAKLIIAAGITTVKIRSVLACEAKYGVCAMCYGRNLATGLKVDIGEAVGIIAAQSIGEPGTQLTLRTFHTGGVAQEDIITGLPRVEEIFEARKPKGEAPVVEFAGTIKFGEEKNKRVVYVTDADGVDHEVDVPASTHLNVVEGQQVVPGQPVTEGSLNPHDILRISGETALQNYLVREVQKVYRSQGVDINDKHIEVIVRSMLRKVKIVDGGDTKMLPGQLVEAAVFAEENAKLKENGGGKIAEGTPVLLGVTKASLATESFLSAASFQETTRVLTDAAIKGKHDPLLGLKENVIIGKLIPAGTGMSRYRNLAIQPEGQDIDDEGRPRNVFLDFNPNDEAVSSYGDVVAPNGQEMNPKVLGPYERQRMADNAVQYEGEYDDKATVAAPSARTQYKPKGINPEDL